MRSHNSRFICSFARLDFLGYSASSESKRRALWDGTTAQSRVQQNDAIGMTCRHTNGNAIVTAASSINLLTPVRSIIVSERASALLHSIQENRLVCTRGTCTRCTHFLPCVFGRNSPPAIAVMLAKLERGFMCRIRVGSYDHGQEITELRPTLLPTWSVRTMCNHAVDEGATRTHSCSLPSVG